MAKSKKEQLAELKKTLEGLHNLTFTLGQLNNSHGLGRQIDQAEKALDTAKATLDKLVASCARLHKTWNDAVIADTKALQDYLENLDSADVQKRQAQTEKDREVAQKAYEAERDRLNDTEAERDRHAALLTKLLAEDDLNTAKMIEANKKKDVVEAQISKLMKEIAADEAAASKTIFGKLKKLIS